jgi:hypothetical protein
LRVADIEALSHVYVPPPVAVNVILDVLQSKIVVDETIDAVGTDPSLVIPIFAVAVQPLLAVTITEYVAAVEIVFVADVVPSFHRYVPPPVAVSVMLVVEQSNTVVDELILATGKDESLVIVTLEDAVQPLLAVTITE